MSIVGVGTGAGAIAAIKSGQIDAISNVDPVMTKLEQDGAIKIVADTRTLKGTDEVWGAPLPAGCLYAPIEFIRKNPNTVQALTNAIVRADKWLAKATPQDILKTVPEAYLLGDKALYLFCLRQGEGGVVARRLDFRRRRQGHTESAGDIRSADQTGPRSSWIRPIPTNSSRRRTRNTNELSELSPD